MLIRQPLKSAGLSHDSHICCWFWHFWLQDCPPELLPFNWMFILHIYSILNQPHNHRRRVNTPAQDLHSQHLNVQDGQRSATQTAAATIGLHNQRISARTARNNLTEALWTVVFPIEEAKVEWHDLIVHHDNAPCCTDLHTIPGSWKHPSSCTLASTGLWTIFERNWPFVYSDNVLDL